VNGPQSAAIPYGFAELAATQGDEEAERDPRLAALLD
jgi:hypothetical protein